MTPGTEQRKLAAIMFTDMVGYSALSQRNEALKWIVHLVADIHQPLHAADRDDEGPLGHVDLPGARRPPGQRIVSAMTAFWMNVLWSMSSQLYWEKEQGNLALYIMAPNSMMAVLLGMALEQVYKNQVKVDYVDMKGANITADPAVLKMVPYCPIAQKLEIALKARMNASCMASSASSRFWVMFIARRKRPKVCSPSSFLYSSHVMMSLVASTISGLMGVMTYEPLLLA